VNDEGPDIRAFLPVDVGRKRRAKRAEAPKEAQTADDSRRLGDESLAEGDVDHAIQHYRRAVKQDDTDDNRLRLADSYQLAERGLQAAAQYEKAARGRKAKPEAHVGLAEVYRQYGKHKAGIIRLQKACELNPGNAFYKFKLAEALVAAGFPADAVSPAVEAASLEPNEPFYHIWLGDLFLSLRRPKDAIQPLRSAITLSPGEDDLYAKLAAAHAGAGQLPEALAAIQFAADLAPGDPLWQVIRAGLAKKCGEPHADPPQDLDPYAQLALEKWLEQSRLFES
jgi:tetratricopeptide (TPR) repeat protein